MHGTSLTVVTASAALLLTVSIAARVQDEESNGADVQSGANHAAMETSRMRTPLLREGAFVVERRGRLVLDDGVGFWVFDAEPDHTPTTAAHRVPIRFIMLPCTKLEQMRRTVEDSDLETVFAVTGRVFVYENHNYLLVIDASLVAQHDESQPPDAGDAASSQDTTSQAGTDADSIINQIRDEVPIARALSPVNEENGEDVDLETLAPEGQLLINRRGRVVRNARGGWEFVFTADGDGEADPPMTLLPCLLLERIQTEAGRRSANARDKMILHGEVFSYGGRNYLLPTMYRSVRLSDNLRK